MHEPHSSGVGRITHFDRVEVVMETHLLYVRCAFGLFLLKGIKKNPFITKYSLDTGEVAACSKQSSP